MDISGNPGRYVWFTALYNARAYYPVLAILFLDLGLTLDQYVLLNMVWAATIFLFEVPSGALADTFGRKRLLVFASLLMIVEMTCLLFAPVRGGWLLFALCVTNRFLSGLSEAAASGADEALAYDSLPEKDREEAWDGVLARAMRLRSIGFVIAMVAGGLLYDPAWLNRLLPEGWEISAGLAHRLPVALVLGQAFACLAISLRMVEPERACHDSMRAACGNALKLTLSTAKWVLMNPATRMVVVIGMAIDCVVRNFATINSSYYRLIGLPEWSFGFIGAALGLLGYLVPAVAAKLNQRYSTLANFAIVAVLALAGLIGVGCMRSASGLVPAMMLMTTLGFLGFTVSRALNRETDSARRATVLSVKGLAFNLAYGGFSLGFSMLLASFSRHPEGESLPMALLWQVPFYAVTVFGLLVWARGLKRTA